MNRHAQAYEKLSKLLVTFEDEILKIPDAEAVAALNAGRNDVDDVTRLISAQLFGHKGKSASLAPQTSPKSRTRRSAAAKVEARIVLLRRLLLARPELSPRLHAVFSAGRAPGAQEVERFIAELVRKGVLSKDEYSA